MYKYNEKTALERFTKKSVWPAYAGCIWAILYAVFVRFLEAAGGGIIFTYGQLKNPESFSIASYIAGVSIMFCGFCLLALVKPWGRMVPRWIPLIKGKNIHPLILLIPTLLGTALLLAHGVSGILTKTLFLIDIININFPGWETLDSHSLALWDLFFYEPWFIIMGLFTALAAAHYAQASTIPLPLIRRFTLFYLIFVLLLILFFVLAIVFDFGILKF